MLERLSSAARRAMVLAHEEAKQRGCDEICGEHILLGLVQVSEGAGAGALSSAGIGLAEIRRQVDELTGRARHPSEHVNLGEPTTRVFKLSEREADQLGHVYLGTGHILLGLIQDRERAAAHVLARLHPDLVSLRQLVVELVAVSPQEEPAARSSSLTTRRASASTATTARIEPDVNG